MTEKVNNNCFIELMNLLKLILTCQILSFKYGKISLQNKYSDNSLSKTSIETRAERERNACSKDK